MAALHEMVFSARLLFYSETEDIVIIMGISRWQRVDMKVFVIHAYLTRLIGSGIRRGGIYKVGRS